MFSPICSMNFSTKRKQTSYWSKTVIFSLPVEKEISINIRRFWISDWWNYLKNSLSIKVHIPILRRPHFFCEISTVDLSYVVTVKSTVEISQNFVAFSEYMNFIKKGFTYRCRQQQVVGHFHQVVHIQEKRVCRHKWQRSTPL